MGILSHIFVLSYMLYYSMEYARLCCGRGHQHYYVAHATHILMDMVFSYQKTLFEEEVPLA